MKALSFAILFALFIQVPAQADIIRCVFTEPFIETTYSMAQQSLTIVEAGETHSKVIANVSFQIKGPALFELVAKDGTVIQKLNLNFKGSNGMSDHEYPYDVQWLRTTGSSLYGGCESNHLKAVLPKGY